MRYQVLLPEGLEELSALEVLKAFQHGRIHTSSLVCAAAGPAAGAWRELREIPELAIPVWELFTRRRGQFQGAWWGGGTCAFLLLVFWLGAGWMMLSGPGWGNWQWVGGRLCILGVVFLACCVLSLTVAEEHKSPRLDFWLLIPFFNCWFGYRIFRERIAGLPPKRRLWAGTMNPVLWGCLGGISLGALWLPGTVAGGKIMFAWCGFFLLLFYGVAGLLRGEFNRRYQRWRALNPVPSQAVGHSDLLDELKRQRAGVGRRWLAMAALAIVGMFAGLTLPIYVMGKIRIWQVNAALGESYLPRFPEDGATPPATPNAAAEIMAATLPELPPHGVTREQWQVAYANALPHLEHFRQILRRYERLGLTRSLVDATAINQAELKLWDYLAWRSLELRLEQHVLPAAWLVDWARCREYELNEDPVTGISAERRYAQMYAQRLAAELPRLSDAELRQERERILRLLEAIPGNVARFVFSRHLMLSEIQRQAFDLPGLFLDNLRASALRHAQRDAALLQQEYFENRRAYQDFCAAANRRGGVASFDFGKMSERENFQHSEAVAWYRLALAGIEVEQYRRRHGQDPANPALPRDPFSGKPLRYSPGEVLYSVGYNETDDHGRAEKRNDHETFDLVFPLEAAAHK